MRKLKIILLLIMSLTSIVSYSKVNEADFLTQKIKEYNKLNFTEKHKFYTLDNYIK